MDLNEEGRMDFEKGKGYVRIWLLWKDSVNVRILNSKDAPTCSSLMQQYQTMHLSLGYSR